jgi:predicted enzyme related to lactoylglutathione lyase
MKKSFIPCIGSVMSADIAVPEHESELRFYSRILTTGVNPLWREDLMNNMGMPIIGLGERIKEYDHLPLQWMPHIQVADVAASAQRALELGGSELMHGKDDNGNSQWAVILDPSGAAFGIIPVIPAEAMPQLDSSGPMGNINWLELIVSDTTETIDFYNQVVGWSVDNTQKKGKSEGKMLSEDGIAVAGICHFKSDKIDMPSVWLIYLPVDDLNESLKRVKQEGGQVIKVVQDKNGVSLNAVIQDPVGVYFGLINE